MLRGRGSLLDFFFSLRGFAGEVADFFRSLKDFVWGAPKFDVIINDSDLEDSLVSNKPDLPPEDLEIDLDEIESLFSSYIGVPIYKWDSYIFDDMCEYVEGKMITSVEVVSKDSQILASVQKSDAMVLTLSSLSGRYGGHIVLVPRLGSDFIKNENMGQSVHVDLEEEASSKAFCIRFYGGDTIEYVDESLLSYVESEDLVYYCE